MGWGGLWQDGENIRPDFRGAAPVQPARVPRGREVEGDGQPRHGGYLHSHYYDEALRNLGTPTPSKELCEFSMNIDKIRAKDLLAFPGVPLPIIGLRNTITPGEGPNGVTPSSLPHCPPED